jgi:hypothetical protein
MEPYTSGFVVSKGLVLISHPGPANGTKVTPAAPEGIGTLAVVVAAGAAETAESVRAKKASRGVELNMV